MLLSDVCLLRTSGLIREQIERPRKTKIGTAHVTRDSDTTFKVKRSISPGRFTQRGLNAYGGCGQRGNRIQRGKVLLRCVCSAARDGGGEGQVHIVSPRDTI